MCGEEYYCASNKSVIYPRVYPNLRHGVLALRSENLGDNKSKKCNTVFILLWSYLLSIVPVRMNESAHNQII
jgi:hypothetical protein